MKKNVLLTLAGFSVAALLHAAENAPSFDQRLKVFQKTAAAALPKTVAGSTDRRGESTYYALAQLAQFSPANAQANLQELERILASITQQAPENTELATAAEQLVAAAKAEREARAVKSRLQMDTLLAQVGKSCLSATNPADLDATLAVLAPYSRQGGYERRQDDPESWQRGAAAYRFVCRWQDYLAARAQPESGEGSANILRELTSSLDPAIMPRSAFLALLAPAASRASTPSPTSFSEAVALLESAKKPEDYVSALRALPRNSSMGQGSSNLQGIILTLLDERQQVLAGGRPYSLYTTDNSRILSPQDPAYTPAAQTSLLAFRRQTQIEAIRKAFPAASLRRAPATDETPETYLLGLIEGFAKEKDWLQTREALEFYRSTLGNSGGSRVPAWLSGDIESFGAYLGAINLDRAEQHVPAISAYQRALRGAGRYLPVDDIAARLAVLKEKDPQAFKESASAGPAASLPAYGDATGMPGAPAAPSLPRGTAVRRPAPSVPMTPASPASP